MYGTDVVGHLASLGQIGSSAQPDGKGVQLRPPSLFLPVGLDPSGGIFLGYGRDDRTVESAREQHPVGYIAHQLPPHGRFERIVQLLH